MATDDVLSRRNVTRWKGTSREDTEVFLLREDRLTIILDGARLVSLLCLPRDLDQLAVGFLHAEGFISSRQDIESISAGQDRDGHVRSVTRSGGHADPSRRVEWVVGTGCGGSVGAASGRRAPTPVESPLRVTLPLLVGAMADLSARAGLYRQSRGCHSAGLFDGSGRVVYFAEDIGRHNAIDKVGGARLLAGDDTDLFLVTTGRMTTEICWKAISLGCPVVASPSVPSVQAVDMAGEAGIALVGTLRGQGMTVYSHPWRVIGIGS